MPTYKAKCEKCGHEEEYIAKICHADDEIPKCPKCSDQMKRAWINPQGGFILKGQGWFKKGGY